MKKILLLLFVIITTVNAAPRFGLIGELDTGAGFFISDDIYNAQLTFTSSTTDNSAGKSVTASTITMGANYKIALDAITALTGGITYSIYSGDNASGSIKSGSNNFRINVGLEKTLSSNILLLSRIALYNVGKMTIDSTKTESSSIFSDATVGIAYIF